MPSATRNDTALAGSLRDAVARLGRRMRAERAPTDLSLGQWAALRTLERHGPMTPSELAGHEKVQPPSMTRILALLEEHGFVTRTPDPDDRRRKDKWLSQRLRSLDPAETAALAAALPVLEKLSRS